ncbi:MAG TPA: nodulation protein NfeD [Candidatus Dormibacteraeota bacterium]
MALRAVLAAIAAVTALAPAGAAAQTPVVERADLDGVINSVMADYIAQSVSHAADDHAAALLIVMNTPGGEMDAMDRIITSLLNSPVPVIVYIAPPGARAASAGLFVAQAADVVAMAPGTNIGSAHPIAGNGADIGGDLGQKVLNDAVARIRDLAASHGRNADWAEQAVRNSVNVGADQAVQLHVADLEAASVGALLTALDGRALQRPHEPAVTLRLAGAQVIDEPMPWWQQLLHTLVDPNVAYLLMLVAVFGLIAEVSSPGAILPGVAGVICGVLALVSLAGLPVNIAAALLIVFSFLLFVADIKAPTHGILTVGGIVAMLLGSLFLIDTGAVGLGVDPWLVGGGALVSGALFGFVVRKALGARSRWSAAGAQALEGALGEVRSALEPAGSVFVAGREWPAVAAAGTGELARGATVRVTGREGERLVVTAARPPGGARPSGS